MKTSNISKLISLLMVLCVWIGSDELSAQSDASINYYLARRDSTARSGDNLGYWSVSLSGGGTIYWGEKDRMRSTKLDEFMSPFGKVVVSRWFSSVWGLRFQIDGGTLKNYIIMEEEKITNGEFHYMDGYVEVMTNIMNWGAYKRTNRPVSVYLLGGVGMAWTPSRKELPAQFSPGGIVGAQLNVRMTDHWSLALEGDLTIVKDAFNSHLGGRMYEGYSTASVGLVYKFQ